MKVNKRESNIELYRIVLMLLIIAHHYVVNSGLLNVLYENPFEGKSIFLFLFGLWGKIGINCFLLITGYFMCKSNITIKKFLKFLFVVEFYNIGIYLLFLITGYQKFELVDCIKSILPVKSIKTDFSSCFIVFYLFIPFINKFIDSLNQKEHRIIILLMLSVYSILGNIPKFDVIMNYLSLYFMIYLIGAYIRIYSIKDTIKKKTISIITILLLITCMISVVVCLYIGNKFDKEIAYYFVNDSNKLLAVMMSISLFLYFLKIDIKSNNFINTTASSIFGILLIHANSNTMRKFLWKDLLNNVGMYYSNWLIPHAIISVIGVFLVCLIIDQIRINTIEKVLFKEDGIIDKIINKCKKICNKIELKVNKM